MSLKRHFGEGDDDWLEVADRESKRRFTFPTVAKDVMSGNSLQEFVLKLEPFFRRLISEEVERAMQKNLSPRSSLDQIDSSPSRAWQLQFEDNFPSTLFTGSRIESEENKPVKVTLVEAGSKRIVTSGPLSSMKINIVVLDGDFGADNGEDWTEKEFNSKILREREGKRPLVTGELAMTLKNGVGYIGEISFTDNSSWIRSRKFRLGARVKNMSTEVRIREAISQAFVVKDHRGESYKKHHPPSLADEVWRLERIAKDGASHKRLAEHKILTVKDFLQLHATDPSSLRNIFGGISNKTWDTIIEHANECVIDDEKLYMYRTPERVCLLLNSVFKVVGATFDGQSYQPLDKLNLFQVCLVEDLKRNAYRNLNKLVPIDDPSVLTCMLLPSLKDDPFSSSTLLPQSFSPPVAQDLQEMELGSTHTIPAPCNYMEDINLSEVPAPQSFHQTQLFNPKVGNSFVIQDLCYGPYGLGSNWPEGSSADENFQLQTSIWPENALFFTPTNEPMDFMSSNFGFNITKNKTSKARWCQVRAAVKFTILVRHEVTTKKNIEASLNFTS